MNILDSYTEDKKSSPQTGPPAHSLGVLLEYPQGKKKAISSSLTGELHLSIVLKPSPWNSGFTRKDIHDLVFTRSLNDKPRVKTKAGKIQQYLVKAKDGLGGETQHKSGLQEFKARGQEGLG